MELINSLKSMGILSAKVVHYVFVLPKTSIAKNYC